MLTSSQLIEGVNKALLDDLEKRHVNWTPTTCIGDIFLRFAPYLKLYTQYVNNYNVSAASITQLTESKPKFREFLQTGERIHLLKSNFSSM